MSEEEQNSDSNNVSLPEERNWNIIECTCMGEDGYDLDCPICSTPSRQQKLEQQDKVMLLDGLVNIYHHIEGKDCPRHLALGMATAAVSSMKNKLDSLRKKFPWRRGPVDYPDVPVTQAHYDGLRESYSIAQLELSRMRGAFHSSYNRRVGLYQMALRIAKERNCLKKERDLLRSQLLELIMNAKETK